MVNTLKGNTLIFFKHLDHGQLLYDMLKKGHKRIFLCNGKTDIDDRELIRKIVEKETDAGIVASFGTFKEGVNIDRLHNIVYGCPVKSPITVLQSIGRGLRKEETKTRLTLYDIADNLNHKKYVNHAWRHFIYRATIYKREQFPQKIFKVKL